MSIGPPVSLNALARSFWNASDGDRFDWSKRNIAEFYGEFKSVIPVTQSKLLELQLMDEWCKNNTSGAWARHWHMVYRNENGEWIRNEAVGSDQIFYAFKKEKDAVLFSLRWSK